MSLLATSSGRGRFALAALSEPRRRPALLGAAALLASQLASPLVACTSSSASDDDKDALAAQPTLPATNPSTNPSTSATPVTSPSGPVTTAGEPSSSLSATSSAETGGSANAPASANGGGASGPAASGGSGGVVAPTANGGGTTGGAGAAATNDAGGPLPSGCEPFVMPDDCTIPENAVLPGELRCTGLYDDWASRTLHCSVQAYTPAHTLWSDGSQKARFVSIPAPGAGAETRVDITSPNGIRYPLGTKFWKEFRAPEASGGRLLETRLLERVDGGWLYTSYVWSEDESTAVQNNDGVIDLYGTGHTVPARQQCKDCHSGRPDYVLGWDSVMLGAGAEGITWEALTLAEWVTWAGKDEGEHPPPATSIPGDEIESAALGYLHANCGVSCHNDTTSALGLETGFFTRLDSESLNEVQEAPVFVTGLLRAPSPNAPLSELEPPPGDQQYVDLRPLDTEGSLLLVRMKLRNVDAAMPRIGTNLVDEQGVALIQNWIESMTEARGYPPSGS